MREIKFRAWDIVNEKWYNLIELEFNEGGKTLAIVKEDEKIYKSCLGIDTELMQFTGLKDKNGKEIYEGDILEWTRKEVKDEEGEIAIPEHKVKGEIYWSSSESGWAFRRKNPSHYRAEYHCPEKYTSNAKFMEVIGNIHDDPELITPNHKEVSHGD